MCMKKVEHRFYARIGRGSPRPITPLIACPDCKGEGEFPCNECQGDGENDCDCFSGSTHDMDNCDVAGCALCEAPPECPKCAGNGSLRCAACAAKGATDCPACQGSALVEYRETAGPAQMRAALQQRLRRSPRTRRYRVRDARGAGFVVTGSGDRRIFPYDAAGFAQAVAVFTPEPRR